MNVNDKRKIEMALDALGRSDIESAQSLLQSMLPRQASRIVNKRTTMPTSDRIVKAQKFLLDRLSLSDPFRECWCCGSQAKLTRCHIRAVRNGGTEDPRNFFLLCEECHRLQPDGETEDVQIEWLTSGHREADFRILTGHSMEDLANLLVEVYGQDGAQARIKGALQAGSDRSASKHTKNQLANQAYALRDLYEQAKERKAKTPA